MTDSFETERLTAERLREHHYDLLCHMHNDRQVMATLGGPRPDAETRAFLKRELAHWRSHGFGLWIFRDKARGAFAGRAGLRHIEIAGVDEVELAYALMAEFWGRGLATEIAAKLVEIGFERLGLGELIAFTWTINKASERVMQKAGFTYEHDFAHAGLPHVQYRQRAAGRPT